MGGIQRNHTFKNTPYFANAMTEVLFHVSTRMNNQNDENKISKVRLFFKFILVSLRRRKKN